MKELDVFRSEICLITLNDLLTRFSYINTLKKSCTDREVILLGEWNLHQTRRLLMMHMNHHDMSLSNIYHIHFHRDNFCLPNTLLLEGLSCTDRESISSCAEWFGNIIWSELYNICLRSRRPCGGPIESFFTLGIMYITVPITSCCKEFTSYALVKYVSGSLY